MVVYAVGLSLQLWDHEDAVCRSYTEVLSSREGGCIILGWRIDFRVGSPKKKCCAEDRYLSNTSVWGLLRNKGL